MDNNEFSRHYSKEHTNLFGFALKLTRSEADAQDLMQDSAIRAYEKCESFQDPSKFKSWFSTIIYNTFVNRYRRKSRRRNLLEGQLETRGLFFNRKTTLNKGFERLKEKDIAKLMHSISDHNCQAFNLYNQGYSYQEISKAQRIPIGTVKSRIFFVRSKMKKMIEAADLYVAA